MKDEKSLYKISGFRGVTMRVFDCPNCGKRRMARPNGYKISSETTVSLDKQTKRPIDVCALCQARFDEEDRAYLAKVADRAKEAAEKGEKLPEGISLEDTL